VGEKLFSLLHSWEGSLGCEINGSTIRLGVMIQGIRKPSDEKTFPQATGAGIRTHGRLHRHQRSPGKTVERGKERKQ